MTILQTQGLVEEGHTEFDNLNGKIFEKEKVLNYIGRHEDNLYWTSAPREHYSDIDGDGGLFLNGFLYGGFDNNGQVSGM